MVIGKWPGHRAEIRAAAIVRDGGAFDLAAPERECTAVAVGGLWPAAGYRNIQTLAARARPHRIIRFREIPPPDGGAWLGWLAATLTDAYQPATNLPDGGSRPAWEED